jgi:pimeloyl-ACP methyl ester carboxylesterase
MVNTQSTFSYDVTGESHPKTIVFIHGWPDHGDMWRHQVAELSSEYRCVAVTLPNFGDSRDRRGGYNFAALVQMLKNTIERVAPSGEPVYLVTHDWGAYIGYLFEAAHPDLVEKMVALDVGGHSQPTSLKAVSIILGYQWTLVISWLIGGVIPPLGTALSRGLSRALDVSSGRIERMRSYFNYPYFYLWMDLLLPWRHQNLLRQYTPQCAVLYLYGAAKPVMFHSDRWLQTVDETGGRSVSLADGDHWFMESHPTEVNDLIREWFPTSRG